MSFLASAHATLSPVNHLNRSAERLIPLDGPVSDPVSNVSKSVPPVESQIFMQVLLASVLLP